MLDTVIGNLTSRVSISSKTDEVKREIHHHVFHIRKVQMIIATLDYSDVIIAGLFIQYFCLIVRPFGVTSHFVIVGGF